MRGGPAEEVVIKTCDILTSELSVVSPGFSEDEKRRRGGGGGGREGGEKGTRRIFTHSWINRLLSLVVS